MEKGLRRKGEMDKWSTGNSYCSETILCHVIMMDICPYRLVRTHRMYNTKSKP